MGMSSSQGRLLSITARLTSNEYESQQISNAKMRLATQSQEASNNYIAALNTQQMVYSSFESSGDIQSVTLTAAGIYQYNDMKNQYVISNPSGQALITSEDAYNFENSSNLSEFLSAYGLEKIWKSTTLQANSEKLESAEFVGYKEAWEARLKEAEQATYSVSYTGDDGNPITLSNLSSDKAWGYEKSLASDAFNQALKDYDDICTKKESGVTITDEQIYNALNILNAAKQTYTDCITYNQWIMSKAAYQRTPEFSGSLDTDADGNKIETQEYKNMQEYYKYVEEFNAEAEDYGTTLDDLYIYEDATKAQWYTNLWYRLNGSSSEKSSAGENKAYYSTLDSKLLDNTTWIQDSLSKGTISIEMASYEKQTNEIPDMYNPTVVNLKGITWSTKIFSSCSDISQKDDDTAIARAEAEYEKRTKEINDKDQKYQNKIKILDTEHTALQTEYESVQSALSKNIDRSFKAFS